MNKIELLGFAGSILFAFSGLPQVIKSIRNKSTSGLSLIMILMWIVGCIILIEYSIAKQAYALLWNYVPTIIFSTILLGIKIYERCTGKKSIENNR